MTARAFSVYNVDNFHNLKPCFSESAKTALLFKTVTLFMVAFAESLARK